MTIQRWLFILAGGTSAFLLAGLVVALVVAPQRATRYRPDTPQGTVATYLRLVENGQVDEAYALTAMRDIDRASFHQQFDSWSQASHRVTLVRSFSTGDTASVTVDIATFAAGAFGASDMTTRQSFTLVRHGRSWRITGPAYLY